MMAIIGKGQLMIIIFFIFRWVYRSLAAPASRKTLIKAEIVGFALWYWVLYHLITEPDHLYVSYQYDTCMRCCDNNDNNNELE